MSPSYLWGLLSSRLLADKAYTPQAKLCKNAFDQMQKKKRISFVFKHNEKDARAWRSHIQGVEDFNTYYPKSLQGRFKRFRAPWT